MCQPNISRLSGQLWRSERDIVFTIVLLRKRSCGLLQREIVVGSPLSELYQGSYPIAWYTTTNVVMKSFVADV